MQSRYGFAMRYSASMGAATNTSTNAGENGCAEFPRIARFLHEVGDILPEGSAVAGAWAIGGASASCSSGADSKHIEAFALSLLTQSQPPGPHFKVWTSGRRKQAFVIRLPEGATLAPSLWNFSVSQFESVLDSERADRQVKALDASKQLQQALFNISEVVQSDASMDEILEIIHKDVAQLMYARNFMVLTWDRDTDLVQLRYFIDEMDQASEVNTREPRPVSEMRHSLAVRMMMEGKALLGPSDDLCIALGVSTDPIYGSPSKAWLGVPMSSRGTVRGAIVVQSYEEEAEYSEESLRILEFVAQHLQMALDQRREFDALEARVIERTQQLRQVNAVLQTEISERQRGEALQRTLFRISELSSAPISGERFFAEVHEIISKLVECQNFFIALLDDSGEYLELVYRVDVLGNVPRRRHRSKSASDYVVTHGRPTLLDRTSIQRMIDDGQLETKGQLPYSWLGVPLRKDNNVIGAMVVQSYDPGVTYDERDLELFVFAAQQVGGALSRRAAVVELENRVERRTQELARSNRALLAEIAERIRVEDRLHHQAQHDVLTGLANRRQLLDRLARDMRNARSDGTAPSFAVLYLDMDQFKLVNDSMGHAAGDEMLVDVARRLQAHVRPDDLVARLGGDEFAILTEHFEDPIVIETMAGRILSAFERPLRIHDRELFPSASIGIAYWREGYVSGEELLRDADAAMYRAKALGRGKFMVFDEEMRAESMRLLDLEADLRRAINNESFEVAYQPVVAFDDCRLVGHEALVRWIAPDGQQILPDGFIGMGEDSGLIQAVDWLVYKKVAQTLAKPGNTYVSINVSPQHFQTGDFAEKLIALMTENGADLSRLRIEITESALMEDDALAMDVLTKLHRHGVKSLLDDFGTGYSALSYLRRFPLYGIKVDRSFVSGMSEHGDGSSEALVNAIVAMSKALDLECVAEGVETEYQARHLESTGCGFAQGFLYGRPGPIAG